MKVAVIGSGEMGRGIALVFAQYNNDVVLEDSFPQALDKARKYIGDNLSKMVEKGIIRKGEDESISSRIRYSGSLEDSVRDVDLVVEAVPEIVGLKQEIFENLDKMCKRDAILATNTSNIKISEISKNVKGKERVLGMHFFNPANRMKLVEIIRSEFTSDEYFEKAFKIGEGIGKTAVKVLKDSPGFIVNRINAPDMLFFCNVLDKQVERPEEMDLYARGQGLPMGPYELMDFVGIDTVAHSLDYYATTLSEEYYQCKTFRNLVKEGKLGKKSGKGFYDWSSGKANIPKSEPSEKVTIMDIFAIEINEAVKLIEERVALPEEIETAVKLGLNRPFGPISVARSLTNAEVKKKLEELSGFYGFKTFEPAASIKQGKLKEIISIKSFPEAEKKEPAEQKSMSRGLEEKKYSTLILEKRENHVSRILLNRPKHNFINSDLLNDLEGAIEEVWVDKDTRVLVITGSGETFTAGAELSQFIPGLFDFVEYSRKGERIFKKLQEIPKVVIAEIKGLALGGGFELSLSCDIRVSTPEAQMGLPEVTLGLLPAWSGSQRLAKLVGNSRAMYLILTGKRVTGQHALEFGVVSELYPKDSVDIDTIKLAESISIGSSPIATSLVKRLINRGADVSYDSGLEMESMAAGILYGTEDMKEGITALLQKRKPNFQNK
ncbi:MAG: 3-hydroxyacyl-CoA dehydrogenase NAD-binding domain-containing protein [Candidatus Thermoplasmatota archaeon]|nr:3-hydroxyacyl-CoA dehydrogenase NAD-binding domain-containing protein [Candidatus Thermoplasmatota archaeon]